MKYVAHRRVPMKGHPVLTEKWVQQILADAPSLLGLGDLEVKDLERLQPRAGRLDMLLSDPETTTRYEVELQLGPTDESHIIRTIEYWDLERKRYPAYDHVGVIVAEDITARFFNVIGLFNGAIPLIAIQMKAIELGDAVTLTFTTVLDHVPVGVEDDDGSDEPRDRTYWEKKGSPLTLQLTDQLLALVREVEPSVHLKYNKNYIGLSKDGLASNFVSFRPRKQHVIAEFKLPRSDELTERLQDAGIEVLAYQTRWGRYRMQLLADDIEAHRPLLVELAEAAHENYKG